MNIPSTLSTRFEKSLPVIQKIKWPLNIAIAVYLLLVPVIIITGGFEIDALGIHMNHISNPISTFVLLLFFRLLFFVNFKDFLLFLGSVGTILIILEIFLRILSPDLVDLGNAHIHRRSPIYGYELLPNSTVQGANLRETIEINSDGMRDVPMGETDAEIKKIAIIGDSFTFGMGVELGDTYAKQLEKKLIDAGIKCRTYNFGVIGYDLWHLVETAKRKALRLNPDLIIIGFYANDMARSVHPSQDDPNWQGHNPFMKPEKKRFFYLSRFWFNVNKTIESKYRNKRGEELRDSMEDRRRALGPENPEKLMHKIMYGTAPPHIYKDFSKKMTELADTMHKHNIPVLGALIPDAGQIHNPPACHSNGVFQAECLKNKIHFIDLTALFEAEKEPRALYLLPLDAHTSPLGHSRIASALAQYILTHQLL